MYQSMTVIAGFLLFYSLFAGRFESRLISGPFLFLLAGILLGDPGLGLLDISVKGETLRLLAELALAIVLFTDAANANLSVLRANNQIPLRLLLIGLPLTLIFGSVAGLWVFEQSTLLEAAILATILAPTDAALGQAVMSNPAVPAPIREGLNMESGLNDGICVPVLLVLLELMYHESSGQGALFLSAKFLTAEIGIGVLVGGSAAWLTSKIMKISEAQGWELPAWRQLIMPGLAVFVFAASQWLGGSGFIAAFVSGLYMGYLIRTHKHKYLDGNEGYEEVLSIIVWLLFGGVVMTQVWDDVEPRHLIFAVASLTVLRMVPVIISLTGTGLSWSHKLFIGWFGPRGLASIVFLIMVMQENLNLQNDINITAICTVVLSVALHGMSANPWVNRMKSNY